MPSGDKPSAFDYNDYDDYNDDHDDDYAYDDDDDDDDDERGSVHLVDISTLVTGD